MPTKSFFLQRPKHDHTSTHPIYASQANLAPLFTNNCNYSLHHLIRHSHSRAADFTNTKCLIPPYSLLVSPRHHKTPINFINGQNLRHEFILAQTHAIYTFIANTYVMNLF